MNTVELKFNLAKVESRVSSSFPQVTDNFGICDAKFVSSGTSKSDWAYCVVQLQDSKNGLHTRTLDAGICKGLGIISAVDDDEFKAIANDVKVNVKNGEYQKA